MAKFSEAIGLDTTLLRAGATFQADGSLSFRSRTGKTTAALQFKKVGNEFIAEYRYRFRCGGCHGHANPLSPFSQGNASREEAIAGAAHKLRWDAVARCGEKDRLIAAQRKELAELLAWAQSHATDQTGILSGSSPWSR
jgi:hypothetical protein